MKIRVGVSLIQNIFHGKAGWIAGFYYIKNCLNALATLPEDQQPDVFAFIPADFDEELLLPEFSKNSFWLTLIRVPCDQHGYARDLQKSIDANPCDVFFPFNNIPSFHFNGAMIGWIPDFQYKHLPNYFSDSDINDREMTASFIVENSNNIICTSYSVAKDIETYYPLMKNKATVLPFRSIFSRKILEIQPQSILHKYGINRKYIYLPNQFWIHKNHRMVFEAWNQLKLRGHDFLLVCTGSQNDYRNPGYFSELKSYIDNNQLTNNILTLGFISREEQIQLFRNAAAILQPSLFEGWNTSIEDARSLGKPLIVSDIAVHHEQCGEYAYYFDRENSLGLANLIEKLWPSLDNGFNLQHEQIALEAYQKQINTFANNLLQLFKLSLQNNIYTNNKPRELVLKLSSELQSAIALSNARLEIIEKIKKNFIRLACKILLKKFFQPKLGQLYQYPPRHLLIPKRYSKKPNISKLPTISVVTPSFKHAEYIERTINSVLNQEYPNLEYIVQDGGSNDQTIEILQHYNANLTHWESKTDKGQSNAINLGFHHATGEIMAYLNSDDILLPGALHYVGQYFKDHPNVDVVYGHRVLIDQNDQEIGRWVLPPHDAEILSIADYVPQETLFWRRRIWDKVGGNIDESFQFAMDWDLILRFKDAGANFKRLPRFIGAFRVHEHQKTNTQMAHIGQKEIRRLQLRCHDRQLSFAEIQGGIRSYLKRHIIYHKLYKAGLLRY